MSYTFEKCDGKIVAREEASQGNVLRVDELENFCDLSVTERKWQTQRLLIRIYT